jgi:hypothetical protein
VLANICVLNLCKGKVRPRTRHEGPQGEQRYTSTISLTSALDESEWLIPRFNRFSQRHGAHCIEDVYCSILLNCKKKKKLGTLYWKKFQSFYARSSPQSPTTFSIF